ncbi:hypothetical protein J3E72DRAFT_184907 [Bipolaris maydis]|nr:hypothetical protein J3E74DRAFT_231656 [Bipolaris maydis]KAJ5064823.1 hypothetical protein J3E74DRAFT_203797 [Bipolaris maydis]KAJ6200031.1 hypothetical protein J3E72DRAFT_184907 [Bipolaris maydis]KAJ6214147.1 hypothetical protein PSV09DRAFT_2183308 [Bipolaris maydis]
MPGGPNPPLSVIASWPPPNYVNPEGRGRVTSNIAFVLTPITFFTVFSRLWVRFYMQRNAGWDDWLTVVALPLVMTLAVLIPWSKILPYCLHIWDVDVSLFETQRKLILSIEILFVLGTGLIKVSILLFFRRLGSRGTSKAFRITTWVAIGVQIASTIAFFISPLLGCRPISGYWEQSNVLNIALGKKFNCNDEGAAMAVAGSISTAQDVICALLPNFIYWKAKIPFRQKAALMAIFATAYVAAVFGALRTYSTYVLFFETYDVSWQLWEIWNWTLLELHIGVICANAPALKVFVKRYLNVKSLVSKGQGSSQAKSSQAKSSQAKSSQTASQANSTPSGKSRAKLALWKNSFANHGYYSQPTQLSVHEQGGVQICEESDQHTSHTPKMSRDSNSSHEHYTNDDVEMGILNNTISYPSQPPEAHRGSRGLVSLYMYDSELEDESMTRGFRHMRIEV